MVPVYDGAWVVLGPCWLVGCMLVLGYPGPVHIRLGVVHNLGHNRTKHDNMGHKRTKHDNLGAQQD